jgi:hypothetical protein
MNKHRQHIELEFVERYYKIDQDGKVFSIIGNKYLIPQVNGSGYITYNIRGMLLMAI